MSPTERYVLAQQLSRITELRTTYKHLLIIFDMLTLVYRQSSINLFELYYESFGRAASFLTYILTSNALKRA